MNRWIMGLLIISSLTLGNGILQAQETQDTQGGAQDIQEPQEESQQAQQGEEVTDEFAYGTVVKVSDTEIVLNEYDFETDQEIENTYVIDENTTLDNFDALKDLSAGVDVGIYYVVSEGKKVVTLISIDEGWEEDENSVSPEGEAQDSVSPEGVAE